jgi:hypothetical protein
MNGGEEDKSSEERTRGGGSISPHGDGRDRRSSSEELGNADGDAQSPEHERVRVRHGEEKGGLSLTGPSWLDQAQ